MKIKDGFVLKNLGGKNIVIAVGERSKEFNGIVNLNTTGVFLWQLLSEGSNETKLVLELCNKFEIDKKTAQEDVAAFIGSLTSAGFIE